jgi:hypothetical protein
MVAGDRNDTFGQAAIAFLARTVPVGGVPTHPPHAPAGPHAGPDPDLTDEP